MEANIFWVYLSCNVILKMNSEVVANMRLRKIRNMDSMPKPSGLLQAPTTASYRAQERVTHFIPSTLPESHTHKIHIHV